MSQTRPEEDRVCAVCAEALYLVTVDDRPVGYLHRDEMVGDRGDHLPVPVGRGDIVGAVEKCDFCSQVPAGWVLPCRSFTVGHGQGSSGDWLACQDCARLLYRNTDKAWAEVTARAVEQFKRQLPPGVSANAVREQLAGLHAMVRGNATGVVQYRE